MSDNAITNAKAWLASIAEMCERLDSSDNDASEAAREEIGDSALSVRVRDGWRNAGAPSDGAEEFEVLLSTGGPALRIFGTLTAHGEPDDIELQWQDWFEPWTALDLDTADSDRLSAFCACFYFGEG